MPNFNSAFFLVQHFLFQKLNKFEFNNENNKKMACHTRVFIFQMSDPPYC